MVFWNQKVPIVMFKKEVVTDEPIGSVVRACWESCSQCS